MSRRESITASGRIAARLEDLKRVNREKLARLTKRMEQLEQVGNEIPEEELTLSDVERAERQLQDNQPDGAHNRNREGRNRSRSPLRIRNDQHQDGRPSRHRARGESRLIAQFQEALDDPRNRDASPAYSSHHSSNSTEADDDFEYDWCNSKDNPAPPTEKPDESSEDELDRFLNNPSKDTKPLELRQDIAERVTAWLEAGIQKKDDRQKLLESIPRTGAVHLEAPLLNSEIAATLGPREVSRDNFFKLYQNITGSTISLAAVVIDKMGELSSLLKNNREAKSDMLSSLSDMIKLNSDLFQMLSVARKQFIIGGHSQIEISWPLP
ncbi:hypothetical protein QAD02_024329 [Eretmocerus hayati]|uniref:Uncharacterized protein n=1 Tax=Eretmocerus hayati TaxID=131215 RepID=A0ACC2Q0Z5_9HYME|nr:hypothetical protein QAD02_024329 [Eretmocerus hayati]